MNILVIGSGAREHAILKCLKKSIHCPTLFAFASSNNPGIVSLVSEIYIGNICEVEKIIHQAQQWKIDLAIIGPEAPLAVGLADAFWQANIPTIGPKQSLARIETDKSFARELMRSHNISGLIQFAAFDSLTGAAEFLEQLGEDNYVVKANGLMSGKGVKIGGEHLHSFADALQFCEDLLQSNHSFVIEEKCIGEEFSLMCFTDGEHVVPMPVVQDHKRAYNNDEGPNTGGMGSYSDANHLLPFLTKKDVEAALDINKKVLTALQNDCKEKYIGILYGSFMLTKHGVKVIEFNARFGDPEALNVLSVLQTDFVEIIMAMTTKNLKNIKLNFDKVATVCKYVVPNGYPDNALKNAIIEISDVDKTNLYLAGVDEQSGKLYLTGSRAAAVVGIGEDLTSAERKAENEIQKIKGPVFHREDIGTSELIKKRIHTMQTLRAEMVT